MKKTLALLAIMLTCATEARAQHTPVNSGLGMGFHLIQNQRDFGFGLQATSPYIAGGSFALRVRSSLMFNEGLLDTAIQWMPYYNLSIGLIGVGGKIGEHIRLYGEGGIVTLLPSDRFSSERMVVGGYGLFGFEFFMNRMVNYFIEIGGIGTGATADKIAGRPVYSNGMSISTGFRFQLE